MDRERRIKAATEVHGNGYVTLKGGGKLTTNVTHAYRAGPGQPLEIPKHLTRAQEQPRTPSDPPPLPASVELATSAEDYYKLDSKG